MFRKSKKNKILIIVLIILVIIGFSLTAYFAVKVNKVKSQFAEIGPKEKLEKIHSYALALEKFKTFEKEEGKKDTTAELERAVLSTDSGVLKNLFREIVLGGNLEKDMDYFMEAIIDSLKFFSRYK